MNSYDVYNQSPVTSSVLELVDTYCRWRKENEPPRGYNIYHPSAFGKCLRNMQYLRYAEKGVKGLGLPNDKFSGKLIRLFDKGHNMHERWARYFEDIGILRGAWKCSNRLCRLVKDDGMCIQSVELEPIIAENKSRVYGRENKHGVFKPKKCICGCTDFIYQEVKVVREDLNLFGRADMVLDFSALDHEKFDSVQATFNIKDFPTSPIVVDMKTCNSYSFSKLESNGPDLAYQIQLVIYSNILDCEYGLLIYENKDKSDATAFKIEKCTDTIFAKVEEQAKTMVEMNKHNLLPPPRPATKDCYECKKCLFKSLCHGSGIWDDPNFNKLRKEFYGDLV